MRHLLTLLTAVIVLPGLLISQTVIQRDNGIFAGSYNNLNPYTEESCILQPAGPCDVVGLQVYVAGGAGTMEIAIAGDPAEGLVPPTNWCWNINKFGQVNINHGGTAQWYNVDISSLGVKSAGYDRIVIQYRSTPGGPRFGLDNQSQTAPENSFLMDPNLNNGNGYPGVLYTTGAHYMVRIAVNYHHPSGPGSAPPPAPTMVEWAREAQLVGPTNDRILASRISAADWNNDGWDDVNIGGLFFQNNGNGTFTNKTFDFNILSAATVWGDIDNDGDLDMYSVNGGASDKIYRNDAGDTWTDITSSTNISNPYPTVQPVWLDYNNDGKLDLFIANGRQVVGGQPVYYQDKLWRNNGNNMFTDVTSASGIAAMEPSPFQDVWGASANDYNRDGFVDIFVATNLLAPDRLYRNNGDGTFTDVASTTGVIGVATGSAGSYGNGAGNEWGDVNNDGYMDLLVGNQGYSDFLAQIANPSLLFMNDGPMNFIFREKRREKGIKFFEKNAGACFFDANLDGNMDLFHCQFANRAAGMNGEPYRRSRMYMNSGPPNYTFSDKTWDLGPNIHGAWTAIRFDFDHDGDFDLLAASPTDSIKFFKNNVARNGAFLSIRLKGDPANNVNLDGYGSEVRVMLVGGKQFTQQLSGGGGGASVSQNSNEMIFGLGSSPVIDKVRVVWPGFVVKDYTGLLPNGNYTLHFDGTITPVELASFTGRLADNNVTLEWRTASETNNAGFKIQKSADGTQFDNIGFVEGAGTVNEQREYTYTDQLDAKSWYRLKQIDFDGSYSYSNTLEFEPFAASKFMLSANYPNPFRQSTSIRYALQEDANVTIKVFDALGRYVRTLVSGPAEPGSYYTAWDGADDAGYAMPAGVYICKMFAGDFVTARTMNLNR